MLGVLLLAGAVAHAESTYQVDLISPTKAYLHVDGAWQEGADCVEAKVSVKEATPSNGTMIKAYFFSASGELLREEKKPSAQAANNGGTVKLPSSYAPGKKYAFFFGVADDIKSGARKWKRVVVVFGKPGATDVKIYPKDDLAKFKFPENPTARAK